MSKIDRLRLAEDNPVFGSNKVFDLFKYSPAVKANGLVFIAGQVGIRPDGTLPETAEEQARVAFQRLGEILKHYGLGFEDLVELVTYHVNVTEEITGFRAVKDEFITADFPAWSIIGVPSLARDTLLVEIKAVACARD